MRIKPLIQKNNFLSFFLIFLIAVCSIKSW